MAKYLDPKADIVFKKIFNDHPHLLKSFLNAVLPLPEGRLIESLEYLPMEQIPPIPAFKRTIADVKCKDNEGRTFIVEMQINWTDSFKQRLLFGASHAIVKQLDKGDEYDYMQPVYGLGIVAESFEHESSNWYHHYELIKRNEPDSEAIEHLQLVFIELPKFPVKSTEAKQLRLLWLRFLREINEHTKEVDADLLSVPEIKEAVDLSETVAFNEGELNAYEDYWDAVRREKTLLNEQYKKGKLEGHAEGERKAKLEIAKKLLSENMPAEIIQTITGLTKEDIELLR